MYVEAESILSSQFCCELTSSSKNKVLKIMKSMKTYFQ